MNTTVPDYVTRLFGLVLSAEATDGAGQSITLDDAVVAVVRLVLEVRGAGRKVLLVGNGGSAAIASHMQNDLCKAARVRAMVFTEPPLLTALTNDDGYETAFETPARLWAEPGDLLVATSSSGRSENILRASDAVLDAGGAVVTLSGFAPDNPLRSKGQVNLYVGSDFYGYVESAHSVLGHCLTDAVADAVREGT